MARVKVFKVEKHSLVNGPGDRVVVYFQGCPIHCHGCQNVHLWDEAGGVEYDATVLAVNLAAIADGRGVTISGGEPFAQPAALAELVVKLRYYGVRDTIVYTGYYLEDLVTPKHAAYPWLFSILKSIDVLVDGPFVMRLDDPLISYRGSRNQRPIDVKRTIRENGIVVLDWDNPEIQIAADGTAIMPVGLAGDFAELGEVKKSPMCGQTKGV